MASGDFNYLYNTSAGNYYTYCNSCHQYYTGVHTCAGNYQIYPSTYTWTACPACGTYYVSGTVHSCPKMLEVKPKYEPHTLECGCKVKTVVVEYCTDLHEKPKEDD